MSIAWIKGIGKEVNTFPSRFDGCFCRSGLRQNLRACASGQLAGPPPRKLPRFLSMLPWKAANKCRTVGVVCTQLIHNYLRCSDTLRRILPGVAVLGLWQLAMAEGTLLRDYRLPYPPSDAAVEYLDMDGDGDPDILRTVTHDGFPVQWIDDDDDMRDGDTAGDMDSDCLMIDRNKDGNYGGFGDLIIDWGDEDKDGKADIQVVADNAKPEDTGWGPGHYMIVVDVDGDGVFNYIDWKDFRLKCWEHSGTSRFFEDYLGNSLFLKVHAPTYNVRNPEYNWENPFLFYDFDRDGLTEMAIRFCDLLQVHPAEPNFRMPDDPSLITPEMRRVEFTKKIDWVSISTDMDNDSVAGNEFDFDMTINFAGPGFDYSDQEHTFRSLRGLPDTDKFFYDARWRQMTHLVYPDHKAAWNLVFKRGKWARVWFVFDEDDDCHRWERVELYQPLDPFKIGVGKKGIDANPQSDCSGDRGEWDEDNSGGGRLYVSRFDGRIHLYGAEWACWRIDQDAKYYQGWSRSSNAPDKFPTVKYTDTDNNGFLDCIEYDLDGDCQFETTVSLARLGIDDRCAVIDTSKMKYDDFLRLYKKVANGIWAGAVGAVKAARANGIDTAPYAILMEPHSLQEKYQFGYWLGFYLYKDLSYMAQRRKDSGFAERLDRAYYSGDWSGLGQLADAEKTSVSKGR